MYTECYTVNTYVWRDIQSTHTCDVTYSQRAIQSTHTCDVTHSHVWYDMTRLCMWNDSPTCVTWHIHMCGITLSHSCMWNDAPMCVTWLTHIERVVTLCVSWLRWRCLSTYTTQPHVMCINEACRIDIYDMTLWYTIDIAYGVATISRLLKIICLFYRIQSLL